MSNEEGDKKDDSKKKKNTNRQELTDQQKIEIK